MYTVIIQNQKTWDSFSQYQPLFAEAVKGGGIGVCKWIESGTTIDTALPELASLTDDKQEWRAVIVRYADDDRMAAFEMDPRNPYDFTVNKDVDDWTGESPIPLVRLTQMLGGVPPLEVKFKAEIIKEDHKAPRTIYVPIEDEQREQAYRRLVRKYSYDGKKPSAILIITVRSGGEPAEGGIGRVWKAHKESESSEFWKRNQFPSICRFMAYDFCAQGPIQKEADAFGFWYSVMLLSTNEWDSSTLQAYRLYTLGVAMDKGAMTESFQDLADRLRDARAYLERSIRRDAEQLICEEEDLPEYRLEVPVAVRHPRTEEFLAKKRSFKLLSPGASSDLAVWNHLQKRAEEELTSCVRSAERTLDQAADKMRGACTFEEEQVFPLNRYQEEDIQRELGESYGAITKLQGKLPNEDIYKDAEVQESAAAVKSYLLGRVMKKAAVMSVLLAAVLLALAAVPAVAARLLYGSGSAAAIGCVVAGSVLCVVLAAVGTLLVQKLKLNRLIRKYNQRLRNMFNQLTERAGDYSTYMSEIASHERGSSYRNISSRKKQRSTLEHSTKYRHIKAIDSTLGKLKKWSKAFRLDVDFSSARSDVRVDIDLAVVPAESKLYTFHTEVPYAVVVNNSGMTMDSPYSFANRIEIVREELYDDE